MLYLLLKYQLTNITFLATRIKAPIASHGTLSDFDSDREDWTSYTEHLEQYFEANDVVSAVKQQAILLSICGASTYQLIRDLVAPAKPISKSFPKLVKLVKDHHQPPPSFIVQRFNFNIQSQKEGETVSAFVAGLRWRSEHCKFEATLDDMLRDRLVCGVQDKRLQQCLLAEENLTFKIAMEVSQAVEAAERNARDLQARQTPKTETVLALNKPRAANLPVSAAKCYRCGGPHLPKDCYFKDAECHFCKKRGHLAKVCRAKTKAEVHRHQHKTHQLTAEDEGTEIYSLYKMANNKISEPIMVTVIANQAALTMEVDTGASASVISEATYQKLSQWKWIQGHLHLSSVKQPTNSSHNGSGYRGICICHQ